MNEINIKNSIEEARALLSKEKNYKFGSKSINRTHPNASNPNSSKKRVK